MVGKASAETTAAIAIVDAMMTKSVEAGSCCSTRGTKAKKITPANPSTMLASENSWCGLRLRPMQPCVKVRPQPTPSPATPCSATIVAKLATSTGMRLTRKKAAAEIANPSVTATRRGRLIEARREEQAGGDHAEQEDRDGNARLRWSVVVVLHQGTDPDRQGDEVDHADGVRDDQDGLAGERIGRVLMCGVSALDCWLVLRASSAVRE